MTSTKSDRSLVVKQLNSGNDYLNICGPVQQQTLLRFSSQRNHLAGGCARARRQRWVQPQYGSDETPLGRRQGAGRNRIGYPKPNRSHSCSGPRRQALSLRHREQPPQASDLRAGGSISSPRAIATRPARPELVEGSPEVVPASNSGSRARHRRRRIPPSARPRT